MDDNSALQLTVQQQAQRISSLEELLKRNENSLSAVLGRVKDMELGMNQFHKLIQQLVSENATLTKELGASKLRVDMVDRSWRSHVQQSENAIWNEVRGNRAPPVSQDPTVSRMLQELTQQRAQLSDMEIGLNRVSDAQAADTNAIRICEQHIQSNEGQLSELMTLQREGAKDTIKRFEQVFRDIGQNRQDVERTVSSIKQQTDKQLRDTAISLEQHSSSLSGFQQEVGSALRSMREELSNGLMQTSQSLKDNEDATRTLEQILRAEVQTRSQGVETANRKLATLEQAVATKLKMVQIHQTDIARLWDTMRSTQNQRQQSDRLGNVLNNISAVGGGAGAGGMMMENNISHINHSNGSNNISSAGFVSQDQLRDLELTTSERFDLIDNHVLQLAETLKRAHAGVEEQVDSLASRFGRMEMRLEQVATKRDQSESQLMAKLALINNSQTGVKQQGSENNNNISSVVGGDSSSTVTIIKELVDTRLRVDRLDAAVEEVKFDVSDLLDAISSETTDMNRRLEVLEKGSGVVRSPKEPATSALMKNNNNHNARSATKQQSNQQSALALLADFAGTTTVDEPVGEL
jgi:hypothetical protein